MLITIGYGLLGSREEADKLSAVYEEIRFPGESDGMGTSLCSGLYNAERYIEEILPLSCKTKQSNVRKTMDLSTR